MMTGSRLDRTRVRRSATTTLALPPLPKLPDALKTRLANIRQSLEQYDVSQETWRVHAQQILDQALNALKLDPGEEVERLQAEVELLKSQIVKAETVDLTEINKQIKDIIDWIHRVEEDTGRDGESIDVFEQTETPLRASVGDVWIKQ